MIRRADRLLEAIAAIGLLGMMTLTSIDVVGRYFVGRPVPGAFELTELLLVAVIFCGLPLVSADRAHIEIDLIESWLPKPAWRVLGRLSHALCAAALAGVAVVASSKARRMTEDAELTPTLGIPLAPFAWLVVVMVVVAALVELGQCARAAAPRA